MKSIIKTLFSVNAVSLTFCTLFLVVILFLIGVPFLDMIELKTYDLRFRSRGHLKGSPKVVMAVVDEKSLDKEGRWPWPRSKIAALIDKLSRDGARVIGFDIGFLEPDENSYLKFINRLDQEIKALEIKNRRLSDFIKVSKIEADNDLALANAIRNSTATVVLGYFFHVSEKELDYSIGEKEIDSQIKRIGSSKYPLIIYQDKEAQKSPFIRAYAPEGNLEILTEQTDYSGYFNMLPDKDGVVRWMPLIIQAGEDIFLFAG